MSFNSPWLLWALFAASVPIIIHLVNRWRHRSVPWAAMEFLLRAARETRGTKKLLHYLILALRVMAVAALVTAFARPLLGSFFGWGSSGLNEVLLVLDRSASMDARPDKTSSLRDANGKLLRQEDIIDYTRTNIKGEYASLADFIRKWKTSDKKKTIEESFMAMGIDIEALKADQGMEDVDDFDFICYVAYGTKPLIRKEWANNVKKKDFFSKYSADAQAVLGILLDKYMNQGITEVEDIKVLSLADFANFGKPAKIVKLFGGKAQYEAAIKELEANIYELEVS